MDVKIKDRKEKTEQLRMTLNMCQLGVDYTQTDLILRAIEKLNELGELLTLEDGMKLHHKWKGDWENYFENIKKEK